MKYRREIDGLRALAVISVMLYHAGFKAFSGGYVGVDIFFVISGYLITSNIVSEKELGTFSLLNFYERRARRILPALFFVMAICIPVAWALLSPWDLHEFSTALIAVCLFISNILFMRGGGYFEDAVELNPLIHTWSLSVEEQYYVLFPLFILIFWRFGKGWLIGLLAIIAITSLSVCQWGAYYKPVMTYFLLPTRGWEIAIGAFAAFFLKQDKGYHKTFSQIMSAIGLFMVFISVFLFNKRTPFPSLYTVLPTVGAVVIILFGKPPTLAGKVLGSQILVGIGLISYSAYLWHQPLLAFTRYVSLSEPSWIIKGFVLLFTFNLAFFTWKYVEQPFKNRVRYPRHKIFKFCLSCGFFFISIGLFSRYVFSVNGPGNPELITAQTLSNHNGVIASNMDERLFIKSRIRIEKQNPNVILVGSSRIMQIGRHNLKDDCLNLSVSGASMEDDIAIVDLAITKFHPKKLIIGADPWLFNSNSGQVRYHSLNEEYQHALSKFELTAPSAKDAPKSKPFPDINIIFQKALGLYNQINVSKYYYVNDDTPLPYKDIIRRDGSRLYNIAYSNLTQEEIYKGFDGLLNYSMNHYKYSSKSQDLFEKFLDYYKDKYEIILVLSPYHPELYKIIKKERPIFLEIENNYRHLAMRKNIKIIGSYDPSKVGCSFKNFYDGMHPKGDAMELVLNELNPNRH
jgi:peptidoglycan/LPS O-acetylase OafA/YrhL